MALLGGGTRVSPRVFLLSPDARWCHGSLLACQPCPDEPLQLSPPPPFVTGYVHYLQVSGPKLMSETKHSWLGDESACLAARRFRSEGRFPPLFSLRALHISMPLYFISFFFFFYKEILVNKAARSKSPNCDSRGRRITLPDGALMSPWISRCSNPSS